MLANKLLIIIAVNDLLHELNPGIYARMSLNILRFSVYCREVHSSNSRVAVHSQALKSNTLTIFVAHE